MGFYRVLGDIGLGLGLSGSIGSILRFYRYSLGFYRAWVRL